MCRRSSAVRFAVRNETLSSSPCGAGRPTTRTGAGGSSVGMRTRYRYQGV